MTPIDIPQPPPFPFVKGSPLVPAGSLAQKVAIPKPLEEPAATATWDLRRDGSSALVSMIVHLLIVILAGLIQLEIGSQGSVWLRGTFESPSTELSETAMISGEVDVAELEEQLHATPADPSTQLDSLPSDLVSAILESDLEALLKPIDSRNSGAATSEVGDGASSALLPGDSASFFGLIAKGKRFVFVIDSSSSMWGARWIEVRKELLAALKKLDKSQSFHVICFDLEPIPLTQIQKRPNKLTPATAEHIAQLEKSLKTHTLGRGTFGSNAMSEALQLRPDAIYLLTDGEFQDDVAGLLRISNSGKRNRKRVPVHIISFHNEIAAERLMYVAAENKGTFRFVAEEVGLPVLAMPAHFIGSGERVLPPQDYLKEDIEKQ